MQLVILAVLAACFCLGNGVAPQARVYEGGLSPTSALEARPARAGKWSAALLRTPANRTLVADANGDGIVTRREAEDYYQAIFRLLDRDRDGAIDMVEFVEALRPRPGVSPQAQRERLTGLFIKLDKNRDQKLEKYEFMRACDHHYAIIDVDGDGEVTVEDFRSRPAL